MLQEQILRLMHISPVLLPQAAVYARMSLSCVPDCWDMLSQGMPRWNSFRFVMALNACISSFLSFSFLITFIDPEKFTSCFLMLFGHPLNQVVVLWHGRPWHKAFAFRRSWQRRTPSLRSRRWDCAQARTRTEIYQEYPRVFFHFFFWKFQFVDSCVSTWESTSCCLFFLSIFLCPLVPFFPSFFLSFYSPLSLSLFMLCSSRHFVRSNFKYHNFI